MTLFTLLIYLVCLGVLAYIINRFLPVEQTIKRLIVWVIIIVAVLLVLDAFGILAVLKTAMVPHA